MQMDNTMDKCEEFKINLENINKAKGEMLEEREIVKLSEVFKVLGDPTRIRIIYVLSKCAMCVCDIAEVLEMTQSAISHQLRLLRTLKLVKFKKEGKSAIYSLDDEHILQLFRQGMEHVRHD
jgi:DNA-binding transcriptional ArsR family regulator